MIHDAERILSAAESAVDRVAAAMRAEIDRLKAENERLTQALNGIIVDLREYGRHSRGCPADIGDDLPCKCGWSEVEARLKGGE